MFAVSVIEGRLLDTLKGFKKRMTWFINNRKDLNKFLAIEQLPGENNILFSQIHRDRLERILQKILDEKMGEWEHSVL